MGYRTAHLYRHQHADSYNWPLRALYRYRYGLPVRGTPTAIKGCGDQLLATRALMFTDIRPPIITDMRGHMVTDPRPFIITTRPVATDTAPIFVF
jgi:hypothetical protein